MDELNQGFDDLKAELRATREAMSGVLEGLAQTQKGLAQTQESVETQTRRFDNFIARFDEVVEMLITTDTDQLQRVTAVEQRLDKELARVWQRIEALEKKAG